MFSVINLVAVSLLLMETALAKLKQNFLFSAFL